MKRAAPVLVIVVVASAIAAWWLVPRPDAGVPIAGVDEALARADVESEFLSQAALESAAAELTRAQGRALVVHRHGHRVFEHFASDQERLRRVDGGELAAAVLALSLQRPEEVDTGDAVQAANLVRDRLWLPLRAGEARLVLDPAAAPRRCCIEARIDDWMRVGDLLLGQGAYHGERVLAADAVRALLGTPRSAWTGDEPLLARDGMWFDLEPGVRLWLAPRRQLSILTWAGADQTRDTLVPNIVLRGLNDQAPAVTGDLDEFVPGHGSR